MRHAESVERLITRGFLCIGLCCALRCTSLKLERADGEGALHRDVLPGGRRAVVEKALKRRVSLRRPTLRSRVEPTFLHFRILVCKGDMRAHLPASSGAVTVIVLILAPH